MRITDLTTVQFIVVSDEWGRFIRKPENENKGYKFIEWFNSQPIVEWINEYVLNK